MLAKNIFQACMKSSKAYNPEGLLDPDRRRISSHLLSWILQVRKAEMESRLSIIRCE